MLALKGFTISSLPIDGLEKQHDLLYADGPLLSHFKDGNGADYLFYWADFDEQLNRWLVWKISKQEFYEYLSGGISLKELLAASSRDYFFVVDKDANDETVLVQWLNAYNLPSEYLPEDDSRFELGMPQPYRDYLQEFSYLAKLREHGFTFKLEPTDSVHGHTVSARDCGSFLLSITRSIDSYIDATATEKFKQDVGDRAKLNRMVNQVKSRTSPRIADAAFGSFEVVVAIDTVSLMSDDKALTEWRDTVVEGYQNDVLDVDFTEEAEADAVVQRFPDPETRKKIFEPIFKILDDPDLSLTVASHNKQFRRSYKGRGANERFKKKVLPQVTVDDLLRELEQKTKLVTAVFKIPEGGAISDFKKKELFENLLFTQEGDQATYSIPSPIEVGEVRIDMPQALECIIHAEAGMIILANNSLGLYAEDESMPQVIDKIKAQLVNLVLEHKERPDFVDERIIALNRFLGD